MSWSDNVGQIIGMKQRERQLIEGQRQVETQIDAVVSTLRAHQHNTEALPNLIEWALEQLPVALRGQTIEAFTAP